MVFFHETQKNMNKKEILYGIFFFAFFLNMFPQTKFVDSLLFKGQVSTWGHYNPTNTYSSNTGFRYIPQMNYELAGRSTKKIDFEASANIYGSFAMAAFDSTKLDGNIRLYRLWTRYSTSQLEIRMGLQKINFGSASLLRPLMWFDQVDPRDPLQLTDGVWGMLVRYYFLNNANIWLWGLYGNQKTKGWEIFETVKKNPEFGGRFQHPVPVGEAAISYHHRKAAPNNQYNVTFNDRSSHEDKIGIDAKFDLKTGIWFEAVWVHRYLDNPQFNNQHFLNIGTDYTFALGKGLTVIYEQLIFNISETAFNFNNSSAFSLVNLTYPLGIFDRLSVVSYLDFYNKNSYNFFNWQREFNWFTLNVMAYINPKEYNIPTQTTSDMAFKGKGIMIMFVLNY